MLELNSKKRRILIIAVSLFVLLFIAAGLYWFIFKYGKGQRGSGRAVAVSVATVQKEDAPLQINALGTVNSTYTATVRSRVDGQLMKIHFREGQLVKEGQLLAELDPRPYQAALTQAEGQLVRDTALLQNAKLDLARYQLLLSQKSIAKQQVDTQAALVRQYQGTVKLDKGAVDNAKLQLTYSRITAPISGRVGLRQVDLGNIVHTTDANGIVVITQVQPINVVFAIPEVSLAQVLQAKSAQKQPLKVEAWDRDNRTKVADGQLMAVDNQLSTSTGTISIKAVFANDKQELFPNQFVNVHLQLGAQPNAITVPTVAVQMGKIGSYVYTVNEDMTVSLAKVKTGATSGDNTIIEEGLAPGQKVVIDGLDKLRDGAKIKVIERVPQASPSASAQASQPQEKRDVGSGPGPRTQSSASSSN
ncbi:MAG: MdtA/MuxA family multidrug efflux RND transporter periplasmic adaptor subunit [Burkholderiaceae bacterium]|nr:MdtA/MuxA family multidrug efflux RND transporter periplasmic adaptor subunit [Burkholderiaceae bacterium]